MIDQPQAHASMVPAEKTDTILLWCWGGHEYAIDAQHVSEVVALPELLRPPDLPPSIVGLLDYRGNLVYVTDLDHVIHDNSHPYKLSYSVMLVHAANHLFGLVAEEFHGLHQVTSHDISTLNEHPCSPSHMNPIVSGVVTIHTRRIFLIDSSDIALRITETHHLSSDLSATFQQKDKSANIFTAHLPLTESCSTASLLQDQSELRRRALQIREVPTQEKSTPQLTLAIIQLGQERYGIDLATLRECAESYEISPIPCCPPHILGHVNHHGDILLVVNIAEYVFVPETFTTQGTKIMIVDLPQSCVAVPVHDIIDTITIDSDAVLPSSSWNPSEHEPLVKGLFAYEGTNLGLLDLQYLLTSEAVIVKDNL